MLTSCSAVTLSWNGVKDISGIKRYQVTLIDAYTSQKLQYTTAGTSYTLNNVDTKYMWTVRAQDNAGNWGPTSQACHFMCVIVK
jgi:hypothetical protein